MAENKTVSQNALASKMANKETQIAAPKEGRTIYELLDQMMPAIKQAVPQHMTPERLLRIATTSIKANPQLRNCTAQSLLGSVMQCAQLGLEPSVLGHAYLIPSNNKKKDGNGKEYYEMECRFEIGYKGLIELARRTGQISSIVAHEVYSKDEFEYEYGLHEKLRHVPFEGADRGEVTKYYAYAKFKDGGYSFLVMSKDAIEKHRQKHSKSQFGPWKNHYDSMAKKTVLKALMKYMPISVEFQKGIEQDQTIKHFNPDTPDMADVFDMDEFNQNPELAEVEA